MKEYDVLVIGGGDVGLGVTFRALAEGLKVALVEKGHVGGTCLNVGCVPSKTLITVADRIMDIAEAEKLGVKADVRNVDFGAIMKRMRSGIEFGRNSIKAALEESKNLDFYGAEGRFTGEYTFGLENDTIRGRKIFIASGARTQVPSVKGLDTAGYLTNESLLELAEKPESLVIIGGGYIAVEYGHFFAALGTKVTMVQRNERLVPNEEPEISDLLKKELEKRMDIRTGAEPREVRRGRAGYTVIVRDRKTGAENEVTAEKILVATGRRSNADLLSVGNTGVETDGSHFIKVDDYLRTGKENIWALGDAIGKQMFTHAGDKEAEIAWHNATSEKKIRMNFGIVPHAVFTRPQIASVGMTEEEARKGHEITVGRAKYSDTVKGKAMMEEEGFAKAIVEKETGRILGFHIIGPEASVLIQEVVNAIATGADAGSITSNMHIFPALTEIIPETLNRLE